MLIIVHRVNTIKELKTTPPYYGVEVDIRYDNRTGGLTLTHECGEGDSLEEYLATFHHAFIIFNIKESGVEDLCIALARQFNIPKEKYFLLDVEFPYLYTAARNGIREIAIRYSEDEVIEQAELYKGRVAWIWIDTNTRLPLDTRVIERLKGYRTCLVSPDRWGRPQDITPYRKKMNDLGFELDAVMVGAPYVHLWE